MGDDDIITRLRRAERHASALFVNKAVADLSTKQEELLQAFREHLIEARGQADYSLVDEQIEDVIKGLIIAREHVQTAHKTILASELSDILSPVDIVEITSLLTDCSDELVTITERLSTVE